MNSLCCECETCTPLLYSREARNHELHSFQYCKMNEKYVGLSNWYITKDYYAYSTGKIEGKRRLFHTFMKPDDEEVLVVDHINGDRSDNRLSNLRLVTPSINTQNYHNKRTSKYPGVYWNRKAGKWISQVRIGKKQVARESFDEELEAYDYYVKTMKRLGRSVDTDSKEYYRYREWLSRKSQTKLI